MNPARSLPGCPKRAFFSIWLACACSLVAAEPAVNPNPLRRIYITHFSHTDFGFTDLQTVCRELQRRYLDMALDTVLLTCDGPSERKFYWTAESLVSVADWWEAATEARRAEFLRAVRSGQLEVTAMPFNQTPFLDAAQWQTMLHWIPEDLWKQLDPKVALQNDVNGFPRAGAMMLLDRGITRLYMGINSDSGGPPFYRPSAFWWKMPDGRRLFVWLNHHYGSGYEFFETSEWRRGPVPAAGDTRFRPPRAGDFFRTDPASLRASHEQCLRKISQLRTEGYPYDELTISVTSQWRMDNDPPFPPLAEFVAAWNKAGLKPELVLTTASRAAEAMEKVAGPTAPEYSGEFTDWWANGTASMPRELAASRAAKRLLAAARSPFWGPLSKTGQATWDALSKDLCLFDEHTFGSSWSVALPWSLDTQAQLGEKAQFAFRPMARAQWLLSQRARTRLLREGEGLFVANPGAQPFSGWVRLPTTSLRGTFRSLEVTGSAKRVPLYFENGIRPWTRPENPGELSPENTAATFPDNVPNQTVKFWVENLPGQSFHKLRLSSQPAEEAPQSSPDPSVETDAQGWPTSARWPGMGEPLFLEGLGDLVAVKVDAFAPRWVLHDMSDASDAARRDELRQKHIRLVAAQAEQQAKREETPHTLVISQWLQHPRLKWALRRLELWKQEPRARLTLRLSRLPSEDPEILYASFKLPCKGTLPTLSCGGQPFTPFSDQIPGSCRDYLAIDGWAQFSTPEGQWLWVSRDAPLITLGEPQIWTRTQKAPGNPERVLAMLFNNFWYTNFSADEQGTMEFQFDLAWRKDTAEPGRIADVANSLQNEPVVLINSEGTDATPLLQRLFEP